MLPKNFWRNLDYFMLLPALALIGIGLFFLYSMSWIEGVRNPHINNFHQQLIWLALALVAGAALVALDYRLWARVSWLVYLVNTALLVALLVFARKTHGAGSWFSIGGAKFQPSEVAKVLFIITFAHFLTKYHSDLGRINVLAIAIAQFAVPFCLILVQPDVGTAVIFVVIFSGMLFVAGMEGLRLFITGVVFASAAIVAVPLFIKGYQLHRLSLFMQNAQDAGGAGWQLHQAQVAMGSGGIFGKGLYHGSQAALGFLPAAHTDFIFSAICEQTGLVGGIVVLVLFLVLMFRIMRTAALAEDLFATYLAAGIFTMLAFQTSINLGMTVGLLPITGIPLPFVSYGGSSLLTNCAAVALVVNISLRRKKLMFT
jgi:rod shape determining protein RodA